MKKFVLLHVGFEQPTPAIMNAWKQWFDSIAEHAVAHVGFQAGREIAKSGVRDLPWGADALTGYNVIRAESMAAAEKIAATNPFVTAIRVYELR